MENDNVMNYSFSDPIELNLSYMAFISGGGLFIPTEKNFALNDKILLDLQLPRQTDVLHINGKVVWITPRNALHHVVSGVGIQFIGPQATTIKTKIESFLDKKNEIGGYTYGISEKGTLQGF